jgi:hypothetical protein
VVRGFRRADSNASAADVPDKSIALEEPGGDILFVILLSANDAKYCAKLRMNINSAS